jgi:hypothetical protein
LVCCGAFLMFLLSMPWAWFALASMLLMWLFHVRSCTSPEQEQQRNIHTWYMTNNWKL